MIPKALMAIAYVQRITITSFTPFLFIQYSALLSCWIPGVGVVENSSQNWLILPDIKCALLKRSQFKVLLWQLPCRPHMRCIKEFETWQFCQDCHGNHERVSLFTGVFIYLFIAYRNLLSKEIIHKKKYNNKIQTKNINRPSSDMFEILQKTFSPACCF